MQGTVGVDLHSIVAKERGELQAVRDFLDNGGSVSAAARAFGVSRPTVRAVKDGTYLN